MSEKKHKGMQEQENIELVRILGRDIRGDKSILIGLTNIKGISWSFSNAICKLVEVDPNKKIGALSEEEIKKVESFMKDAQVPSFLKNRRKDFDSGEDQHLSGSDLNLRGEFDVKRLRKIKSYRGIRHANKLPVRGQRTKSNFRSKKKKTGAVGAKKK